MAEIDFREVFGLTTDRGPDKKMSLALLLRAVAGLLAEDDSMKDEREQGSREIHVRPRMEPLGGA